MGPRWRWGRDCSNIHYSHCSSIGDNSPHPRSAHLLCCFQEEGIPGRCLFSSLYQVSGRFNEHFAVPAAKPELAYRTVSQDLDLDGILCFKERRKVARDNTVDYGGKTLQIYPQPERTTYVGAHVEVQKRLDGRLLVCHKGKILTPGEAPLSPSFLRQMAENNTSQDIVEPKDQEYPKVIPPPQPRIIWYVDPEMKHAHRDMVKAA